MMEVRYYAVAKINGRCAVFPVYVGRDAHDEIVATYPDTVKGHNAALDHAATLTRALGVYITEVQ